MCKRYFKLVTKKMADLHSSQTCSVITFWEKLGEHTFVNVLLYPIARAELNSSWKKVEKRTCCYRLIHQRPNKPLDRSLLSFLQGPEVVISVVMEESEPSSTTPGVVLSVQLQHIRDYEILSQCSVIAISSDAVGRHLLQEWAVHHCTHTCSQLRS